MKLQLALLSLTALSTGISFINAPYPAELQLQHVPTVVILLAMAISSRFFRLSQSSFTCLIAFLWIHILGARWIYSFVPYDQWSQTLFHFSISDRFGWTRNHYDRFVHLASGILLLPPAAEGLQRLGGMGPKGAALMAASAVMAVGALYEIVEWQIAVTLSPRQAEAYNGQQGDLWDPQKDLALALVGAILSAALVCRHRYARE